MKQGDRNGIVLLDTRNRLDWTGHGGDHRSLQIAEILERAGLSVRVPGEDSPTTLLERHLRGLALWSAGSHPIHHQAGDRVSICGRQAVSNRGRIAKRYLAALSEPPRPRALLWECAFSTIGPALARRAGCPVIAVPENVYTLERGFRDSWRGHRGLAALRRELDFLGDCAAVFCISREEQWLLRLQGIDAGFLPYFPPVRLEEFLLDVRRHRSPGGERRFLLLGSAFHPPTGDSLEALLRASPPCRAPRTSASTWRATARSASAARRLLENVFLHGTVGQEQLRELLVAATAAIVYQRPSVGVLVKIPELLLAGVPVIANVDASRSTWSLPGIVHYESLADLDEVIRGPFPEPPVLERQVRAEERFARAVADIAAGAR